MEGHVFARSFNFVSLISFFLNSPFILRFVVLKRLHKEVFTYKKLDLVFIFLFCQIYCMKIWIYSFAIFFSRPAKEVSSFCLKKEIFCAKSKNESCRCLREEEYTDGRDLIFLFVLLKPLRLDHKRCVVLVLVLSCRIELKKLGLHLTVFHYLVATRVFLFRCHRIRIKKL
jgi:hypothetical protein